MKNTKSPQGFTLMAGCKRNVHKLGNVSTVRAKEIIVASYNTGTKNMTINRLYLPALRKAVDLCEKEVAA